MYNLTIAHVGNYIQYKLNMHNHEMLYYISDVNTIRRHNPDVLMYALATDNEFEAGVPFSVRFGVSYSGNFCLISHESLFVDSRECHLVPLVGVPCSNVSHCL